MPDQTPPAPEGCVYGPWWDESVGCWFAVNRQGSAGCYVGTSGVLSACWLWTSDGCKRSDLARELLRLAKENAELCDLLRRGLASMSDHSVSIADWEQDATAYLAEIEE